MGIPITVGATGHRLIRAEDVPALRARVRSELKKLMARCPNSGFVMLNSLAIGTDTLCAEEALSLGIRLVCPLPMPVEEYRKDFSDAAPGRRLPSLGGTDFSSTPAGGSQGLTA